MPDMTDEELEAELAELNDELALDEDNSYLDAVNTPAVSINQPSRLLFRDSDPDKSFIL